MVASVLPVLIIPYTNLQKSSCNSTLLNRLKHSPTLGIRGGWPFFSITGHFKYSLQHQNIEKKTRSFTKHPFFLPMLLSPHFKNSILGGLGIIITTLFSIYDLEGFKRTAKCSLRTCVHPPLPTMAHTFPWLSSTRQNCFSHVSQLYFNKITKGQKESRSSLLHAGVSTEWVQLPIFSGVPFFGITQRVFPSCFHWSSQLKISIRYHHSHVRCGRRQT